MCELLHKAGTTPRLALTVFPGEVCPWPWAPVTGCLLNLQAFPALLVKSSESSLRNSLDQEMALDGDIFIEQIFFYKIGRNAGTD